MKHAFFKSLRLFIWFVLITGIVYPLMITAFAYLAFNHKANGQMVLVKDKVVGSKLIGQRFSSDKYFWGRPSTIDYNPLPSGASNLGPISAELKKTVKERREHALEKSGNEGIVPTELIYASGSGLDPHISPVTARYQIDRIVKARGWDPEEGRQKLLDLIVQHREGRKWGFFGTPVVNVLMLNIALDDKRQEADQ